MSASARQRAVLRDLRNRYREVHRRKRGYLHALKWTRPGTVWAMDFAHAPCPIDTWPL